MMKILVTGHSGYIGTILTQMLLKSGHQVVGIDIDLYVSCSRRAAAFTARHP
jgi:nucleoside-diphosphate-sugar epimerase